MIQFECRAHRKALKAESDDAQKIFVMLKLLPTRDMTYARAPLAIVLLVDTSGSMQGDDTRLERAIEACHGLLNDNRLRPDDLISVIQFNDTASILLPLLELDDRKKANAAVDSLRNYSGGTVMGLGMDQALAEIRKAPLPAPKRVLLFTDGETTDEERCRLLAAQFGPINAPLVAVGIGDEINEVLLREAAATSMGRPYHLHAEITFGHILEEELGSLVREVVTDVRMNIGMTKGVTLDSAMRVFPSISEVSTEEKPFRMGNVSAGNETVFILEFTVSGLRRPPSRARLVQIQLTAEVPGMNRREELPPQDLFMDFTTDTAAISQVDAEVMDYVKQRNVDRLMQQATQQAASDPAAAGRTLQLAKNMTLQLKNANVTRMLDGALDELNKTGTISMQTRKTISLGGRTKTIKTGSMGLENIPSLEEIRKATGV
jgi:Ca-activated chloride channel family protein